jgi:hypothetical protein
MTTLFGVAYNQGEHGQYVLEVFRNKVQVGAKPLLWYHISTLTKVDLIYKPNRNNVVFKQYAPSKFGC